MFSLDFTAVDVDSDGFESVTSFCMEVGSEHHKILPIVQLFWKLFRSRGEAEEDLTKALLIFVEGIRESFTPEARHPSERRRTADKDFDLTIKFRDQLRSNETVTEITTWLIEELAKPSAQENLALS